MNICNRLHENGISLLHKSCVSYCFMSIGLPVHFVTLDRTHAETRRHKLTRHSPRRSRLLPLQFCDSVTCMRSVMLSSVYCFSHGLFSHNHSLLLSLLPPPPPPYRHPHPPRLLRRLLPALPHLFNRPLWIYATVQVGVRACEFFMIEWGEFLNGCLISLSRCRMNVCVCVCRYDVFVIHRAQVSLFGLLSSTRCLCTYTATESSSRSGWWACAFCTRKHVHWKFRPLRCACACAMPSACLHIDFGLAALFARYVSRLVCKLDSRPIMYVVSLNYSPRLPSCRWMLS